MYNEHETDLTLDERTALASLPREISPGDLLEGKVVRALREQGHFGVMPARRSNPIGTAWKIAAALALFAGGVATGRYALASDSRASASISAPASLNRDVPNIAPRTESRPVVRQNETVVAEREMWL